ncbi:hypothetical protein T03_17260 [Trichinella britovi]|uniref:Uncharacterized protein n=1 Tax=Trichinella britovi TaxID=45882 RepID=A0A0V1C6T7_TRIBR|nr:hypothetical protein T03_17260 [Trichinella britovi]
MYDRNVMERMLFSYQCGRGWVAPAFKRPMQTLTGLWNLAALHFCSFRAQFISTSSSVHTFNITVSVIHLRMRCINGYGELWKNTVHQNENQGTNRQDIHMRLLMLNPFNIN